MKSFIVYAQDGTILRTGNCPDNMLSIQAGGGEFVMEGAADDSSSMITNGVVTDRPAPLDSELIAGVQDQIRSARTSRLSASDWTQVPDAPLTTAQRNSWAVYRQSLRDLPSQYQNETDFANVVFPNPP